MGAGQRGGAGNRTGQQDQLRTQQQDRQRVHATTQQQDRYRDCVQKSDQLRKQVRQMKQLAKKNQIKMEDREQLRQQFRTQSQEMQQEHERLMNVLTQEQKVAVQNAANNANAKSKELAELSDALDFELQQEELNREKISTQAQKMETSLNQLQKQYRAINNELEME